MRQSRIKYLIIILSILAFSKVSSQTCGFGCLGLSGVYGGYSLQQYEADGLNQYLGMLTNPFSSVAYPESETQFKESRGFKLGINIVRADYSNFFFTFKGYYQFLSEQHSLETDFGSLQNPDPVVYDIKLDMNNWGIGLDFGIPLYSFIDLKIIESELKFFSPKLSIEASKNTIFQNSSTYTPDKVKMGFSVGSGLIFNVMEDYISIEATGMYTFMEIDNLTSDLDGTPIPTDNSETQFISKGGLQAFIQLNLGIPL